MSWEALRGQVRRLENEVEQSLTAYAKASAALTGGAAGLNAGPTETARWTRELEAAERLGGEIHTLLIRLEEADQALSTYAHGASSSPALLHTLQRHQEVLAEYRVEFRRLRVSVRQLREYAELLSGAEVAGAGVDRSADGFRRSGDLESGLSGGAAGGSSNTADPILGREAAHVNGAHRSADTALGQGLALRDDLLRQRQVFASLVDRMGTAVTAMPSIGRLVSQIRRRKRRDVILVAVTTGVLSFLTLMWKLMP